MLLLEAERRCWQSSTPDLSSLWQMRKTHTTRRHERSWKERLIA
jgi:hypothetical protein